ncbi:uncharacterized protein LOC110447177 [Mizuhopecten yessoensis]|uniref:uncharacterized protein LOC110447177 n=1 Tax=Mizuhopecten yessoensis TaxID=6573 RepID=UPI000B457A1D|nr:uncharacterized protein LOC110447177 [Mizuhopecten yessoensis]
MFPRISHPILLLISTRSYVPTSLPPNPVTYIDPVLCSHVSSIQSCYIYIDTVLCSHVSPIQSCYLYQPCLMFPRLSHPIMLLISTLSYVPTSLPSNPVTYIDPFLCSHVSPIQSCYIYRPCLMFPRLSHPILLHISTLSYVPMYLPSNPVTYIDPVLCSHVSPIQSCFIYRPCLMFPRLSHPILLHISTLSYVPTSLPSNPGNLSTVSFPTHIRPTLYCILYFHVPFLQSWYICSTVHFVYALQRIARLAGCISIVYQYYSNSLTELLRFFCMELLKPHCPSEYCSYTKYTTKHTADHVASHHFILYKYTQHILLDNIYHLFDIFED